MKIGVVLLGLLLAGAGAGFGPSQNTDDKAHQQWLEERYKEATSIQPGMTRADLVRLFSREGGFQGGPIGASPQRYILKSCFMIHVEVTFDRLTGDAKRTVPDDQVKIVAVSKPFLAPMVID